MLTVTEMRSGARFEFSGSAFFLAVRPRSAISAAFSVFSAPPLSAAQLNRRRLDPPPQRFKMLISVFGGGVRKDDCEFFAATAESLTVAANMRQTGCDHA